MSNDREKAELGASTLKIFCESWGNDIHARILLEILFKGIMHEEALFIFGKQEQAGDKVDNNIAGGINSDGSIAKYKSTKPTTDLGKEDTANYP